MGQLYFISVSEQVNAQNKHFLAFKNTGTNARIYLKDLRLLNAQGLAVVGVLCEFNVIRITAITGGTAVTPVPADSGDGTLADFTCVHTATSCTEGATLMKHFINNDELPVTGIVDPPGNILPVSILSKNGEGITLKQITNSIVGQFGILAIIEVCRF
jgi:hypothetical protein